MNAQSRQQPVADEGADQADDQIADEPKSAALHDSAGQPAGNNSDDKDDEKALVGKYMGVSSYGTTRPSELM